MLQKIYSFVLPKLRAHHENSSSLRALGQRAKALFIASSIGGGLSSLLALKCPWPGKKARPAGLTLPCLSPAISLFSSRRNSTVKRQLRLFILPCLCIPCSPAPGMPSLKPAALLCLKTPTHPSTPQIEIVVSFSTTS